MSDDTPARKQSKSGFADIPFKTADDEQGAVVTEPPHWFRQAVAQKPAHYSVEVDGCPIHYMAWGEDNDEGLLLVHGNGAHAYWWAFIAPLLAGRYHVVSMDLSGMGDSGHRDAYSLAQTSREQLAVCRDAGLLSDGKKPVIAGHSLGGMLSAATCREFGDAFSALIMLDSFIPTPKERDVEVRSPDRIKPSRIYEDQQAALDRFRLIPPQPCENQYLHDYIARHSVMETEGGWTWKFDPKRLVVTDPEKLDNLLAEIQCPVIHIRGEHSVLVTEAEVAKQNQMAGKAIPTVTIPAARHHLLIDQPLAVAAALQTVLATWPPKQSAA